MSISSRSSWPAGLVGLLVWAAAAASLTFWGLRLSAPVAVLPLADSSADSASAATLPATDPAALGRFLGAIKTIAPAAAPASADSRFVLKGVVAGGGTGAALISIDGQPARPYRVGAVLVDGVLLQSIGARRVQLAVSATGAPLLTLTLPARP